ncbi:MAG: O-antigen ligase family protein [Oscillospiraceae bacterium]|nr:O-antigen ligase family protein [Oscillospiraceae bacterium]
MKRIDSIRLRGLKTEYPIWGILLVAVLLMLSPFTTSLLSYVAFVICLYRIVRYDEKVFTADYCLLIPFTFLFQTPSGMSLVVWLCLAAAAWYFVRGQIVGNSVLVFLLLLLNYMILRMQMNINDFVLCLGQLFVFYILLPQQDSQSAEWAIKVFCWSMILSSVYALVFRSTHYLNVVIGYEDEAIWGSGIKRFQGLFRDTNYYMALLTVGLALLCKLKEAGRLHPVSFWVQSAALAAFGVLTYSKTFFLMLVLLVCTYIIWQFWNKKIFRGVFFTALIMVAALYILSAEDSPFAVVIERLTSSSNLSDLTTNRSDLFVAYWKAITDNVLTLLFGYGFNAPLLQSMGTHNLYLEITYYAGLVGLVLIVGFCVAMVRWIAQRTYGFQKQNFIAKYVALLVAVGVYCSLQGMFLLPSYATFFLGLLSLHIVKKEKTEKAAEFTA